MWVHHYHHCLEKSGNFRCLINKWITNNRTASSATPSTSEGNLCPKAASSFSSHGWKRKSKQRHFMLLFPLQQLRKSVPHGLKSHRETLLVLWDGIVKNKSIKYHHIIHLRCLGGHVIPIIIDVFLFCSKNLHAVCRVHMILFPIKMAVDLKCFHCLSKYVLKEPYFIKSHKVASRTDFIREVESVLMPQIYLGLHVRNTPKV